jgi:hypothetical protein
MFNIYEEPPVLVLILVSGMSAIKNLVVGLIFFPKKSPFLVLKIRPCSTLVMSNPNHN